MKGLGEGREYLTKEGFEGVGIFEGSERDQRHLRLNAGAGVGVISGPTDETPP